MTQRQSNLELLRCISMFFVLMVHCNYRGILDVFNQPLSPESFIRIVVEAIAIIGVNCFILISGYFGIKLRVKSLANLCFQIYFFAALAFIVFIILRASGWADGELTNGLIIRFVFPVSHWIWFTPCYILLMLFSPILNAWLNSSSLKSICILTVSIYVLTYFWGIIWQQWHGFGGYEVGFFVILYSCGHIIHRLNDLNKLPSSRLAGAGYLTGVMLLIIIALIQYKIPVFRSLIWSYDCPIVFFQSVMMFIFFVNMKINYNKAINFIGRSSFAVLLFHISPKYGLGDILPTICESTNYPPRYLR